MDHELIAANVARWAMRASEAGYDTLNDAALNVGQPGLAKGSTEVWYMKPSFFRDGKMGMKWLVKQGLVPDPRKLDKTHVLLGEIKEGSPDKVYHLMQGETWSPRGEARGLIRRKGLQHTSMSVGDVVVKGGKAMMVDRYGFTEIPRTASARFVSPEGIEKMRGRTGSLNLRKVEIEDVKPGDTVQVYNQAHSTWQTHDVSKVSRHGKFIVLHDRRGTFYRDVPGGPNEMFIVRGRTARKELGGDIDEREMRQWLKKIRAVRFQDELFDIDDEIGASEPGEDFRDTDKRLRNLGLYNLSELYDTMERMWNALEKGDSPRFGGSRKATARRRRAVREPANPIFEPEDADELRKQLLSKLKAPVVSVRVSTLGGPANTTFMLAVSLDPKEEWPNRIFENSRYFRASLGRDGVLEQFTVAGLPKKFRKRTVKSVEDAIKKLNAYIGQVS